MLILFDIGNTHTHIGLADSLHVTRHFDIPTACWHDGAAELQLKRFVRSNALEGAALCSVVPPISPLVMQTVKHLWKIPTLELRPATLRGVGLNYPRPNSIGPDRLANAIAVRHHFGAPAIAVDFGTAVTFDVVDCNGDYAGGIIAPGLSAMTEYLHEKTALLPKIKIREVASVVGKSTGEAMLIGTVHGYRGMVRELIAELKKELRHPRLPVVATGGYAELIAAGLPEISAVKPLLTLEGLRLLWHAHNTPRM